MDMFEGTAASGPEVCVFAFVELPSYDNPSLEAVLSEMLGSLLYVRIDMSEKFHPSIQLLRSNLLFFVTALHTFT